MRMMEDSIGKNVEFFITIFTDVILLIIGFAILIYIYRTTSWTI